MSLSRFLLCTSLSLWGLGAAGCGGGDDSCGTGGAPEVGLVAAGGGASMSYGALTG